jgi:hypothetical protein
VPVVPVTVPVVVSVAEPVSEPVTPVVPVVLGTEPLLLYVPVVVPGAAVVPAVSGVVAVPGTAAPGTVVVPVVGWVGWVVGVPVVVPVPVTPVVVPVAVPAVPAEPTEPPVAVPVVPAAVCATTAPPVRATVVRRERMVRFMIMMLGPKLNTLLRLYPDPINVVVFHGSSGRAHLGIGGVISWNPSAVPAFANELGPLVGSVTSSRPRNIDLVPIGYGRGRGMNRATCPN